MADHYHTLEVNTADRIVDLWLNRPEHHNALNLSMVRELLQFFEEINRNDQVQIVVIRGKGKSFCSGADLEWMQSSSSLSGQANQAESMELSAMFEAIYQCRKIVIGLAHGNIFGGGNGILAACDIAYCTADSRFSLSETRLGLVAATIAPYLLNRMEVSVVKELLFTAFRFDGEMAAKSGLVNRTFPSHDDMAQFAQTTIQAILDGGPSSVLTSKALLNRLSKYKFPPDTTSMLAKLLADTRVSEEAQEGMKAFLEKRKPLWQL